MVMNNMMMDSGGIHITGGAVDTSISAYFTIVGEGESISDYFTTVDELVHGAGDVKTDIEGEIIGSAPKNKKIIKYDNDRKAAKKDETMRALLPEKVTDCAIGAKGDVCLNDDVLAKLRQVMKMENAAAKEVMAAAKKKTNCGDEKCVVKAMADDLGPRLVKDTLKFAFKIDGPTDSELFDHISIEHVMMQYRFRDKTFFPYNFNMINYADCSFRNGRVLNTPDTLATVKMSAIYADGYRTAGCIINSDTYQGPGKHWMALFVDMREPKCTVEFFNSSGNSPAPEWVNWMIKTKNNIEDEVKKINPAITTVEMVRGSNLRHQHSRTECGAYSLFYVWARLNRVPIEYFSKTPIPDQLMFEFRQHLFAGERGIANGRFDFDKYAKSVNIKWEHDD